ncbi:MAG TPA: nucleoside triphosphate pyrophosphohydrolase [Gammaproteobacteria bacterium]|nr:nucleoside triphosphate pyrophosphohydrolase [Gammaproteobacteria bacterium]HIK77198.1 nucleoside triphosphate pyrophosphohydrolase [Gammaproteobacteria bacterium]
MLEKLHQITSQLRDPEKGCPWDREQTFESIAHCAIEEAYEVVEAIENKDYEAFKNELGDLLFQVAFHSNIAEEMNLFTFDDVVDSITTKLINRHPHVFSDLSIEDSKAQTDQWERIKIEERKQKHGINSILDDIGTNQPALNIAYKIGKRARSVGFDWSNVGGVIDKIEEEIEELKVAISSGNQSNIEEEAGDLLFSIVSLSRHTSIDPESALRKANKKFDQRFRSMERVLKESNREFSHMTERELDKLWENIKEKE